MRHRSARPTSAVAAAAAALLLSAACGDATPGADEAPAVTEAVAAEAPDAAPAAAPTSPGARPGRWAGVAEGGFKGDSILFTVAGDEVRDVEFRGHWRCTSSTSSFKETKRMDVGQVPGSFAVAAEGTFGEEKREPYLLWTVAGRFTEPARASGTIRVEYATECDTHVLHWSAAPVDG